MRLSEWHYQPRHVNPRIQGLSNVQIGKMIVDDDKNIITKREYGTNYRIG